MLKPHDELARIQKYEEHLKRLIKLKKRPLTQIKHSLTSLKPHYQDLSLHLKPKRMNTQQFQTQKSPISRAKTRTLVPLPLVPQNQKSLVTNSMKDKKISERQAEIFLQNYLLSRRILNVKSCIKIDKFEKSYKNHQKYSTLRSKSRVFSMNLSESRLKKFKQFELQSLRQSSVMGFGRYTFGLSIKKFQKLRRQNEEGTLYNIVVRLNKKRFKFSNLSMKKCQESHRFHFRKKDIQYPYEVFIEIEVVARNEVVTYGVFTIDLTEPFCKMKGLSKTDDFLYQKESQIERVKAMNSQKLVGTVVFDYQITTEQREL